MARNRAYRHGSDRGHRRDLALVLLGMSVEIKASCVICGTVRNTVEEDTWFFVGGPHACVHLCSRKCLVEYAQRLRPLLLTDRCPHCLKLNSYLSDQRSVTCAHCKTEWKPTK